MLHTICKLLAIVFHPALMPTLGYVLLFGLLNSEPFGKKQGIFLGLIFLGTFVVPAFFLLTLRYTGFIRTLSMERKEERLIPFLFTTVFYTILAYLILQKALSDFHVVILMGGVALSMCLVTLVTLVHKISVHSVGISGILGFIFGFQVVNSSLELLLPTAILFVLTGIVMSSRLYLAAHTPNQVWSGFLVGFGTCFGIVWLVL